MNLGRVFLFFFFVVEFQFGRSNQHQWKCSSAPKTVTQMHEEHLTELVKGGRAAKGKTWKQVRQTLTLN